MIPISKVSSGEMRHFTCGRWANVEIPEKPHYDVVSSPYLLARWSK